MPDARLINTRNVYPEQPQWRRPSDNAAERLARSQVIRVVELDPKPFDGFGFTFNVIEGDQH